MVRTRRRRGTVCSFDGRAEAAADNNAESIQIRSAGRFSLQSRRCGTRLFFWSTRTVFFWRGKRKRFLPFSCDNGFFLFGSVFLMGVQFRFAGTEERLSKPHFLLFLVKEENGFWMPKRRNRLKSSSACFCFRRTKPALSLPRAPLPLMRRRSEGQATARSPAAEIKEKL